MTSLGSHEITGLPPTRAIRAASQIFRFAVKGNGPAILVTAPAAAVCGVLDQLAWLRTPVSAPLFVLLPGLALALLAVLPPSVWIGVGIGCWCGGLTGLALPLTKPDSLLPPELPPAVLIATTSTAVGIVSGALVHLLYEYLRPQMVMRLVVAILPGAFGSALGAAAGSWSPGAPYVATTWGGTAVHFHAYALGLMLLAPSIFIWWQASEGCILSSHGRRLELGCLVAALAFATVIGLGQSFPLQFLLSALLALDVLIVIGIRYPVRVVAPLASAQIVATGICWTRMVAAPASRAIADALGVVALQMILLGVVFTILMLSSAHNERRLAEWRLRGYAQRLARAEEERRRDSASTVRETVAQTLIGVRFALSRLERLSLPADAKAVVSNVVDVVRTAEAGVELSIRELGPQGLEDHDLLVVLESYLARLREQAGVNIKLLSSGSIDSLPLSIRRLAFTVVSELVRNAAVHASATKIDVRLHADRVLSIAVVDDGRGFDPSAVFGRPEGDSGLTRMRDRVASEGGRFTLRSALGAGCVVEVSVPIVGGWSE